MYYTLGLPLTFFFFFFNDTATTEIYTLSLHDALPIYQDPAARRRDLRDLAREIVHHRRSAEQLPRSEEHTSELQSQSNLVCRLLLEKKKKKYIIYIVLLNMYTPYVKHNSVIHTMCSLR